MALPRWSTSHLGVGSKGRRWLPRTQGSQATHQRSYTAWKVVGPLRQVTLASICAIHWAHLLPHAFIDKAFKPRLSLDKSSLPEQSPLVSQPHCPRPVPSLRSILVVAGATAGGITNVPQSLRRSVYMCHGQPHTSNRVVCVVAHVFTLIGHMTCEA